MLDSQSGPSAVAGLKRERTTARKILTWPSCRRSGSGCTTRPSCSVTVRSDLIHLGHVIHFEEAASHGDVLVVTLTADQYITKKRGGIVQRREPPPSGRRARDRRLRRPRQRIIGRAPRSKRSIPDQVSKRFGILEPRARQGPRTSFREKQLVESYGGRIHFTDRRNVLVDEAVRISCRRLRRRRKRILCSATTASSS
jgi:hypothetical protein